jgi:phosphopantetheinyl transferase
MNILPLHRDDEPPAAATPLMADGTARVWLIDSTVPAPGGPHFEPLGNIETWLESQRNNPARIEAYRAAHLWTRSLLRCELGMPPGPIEFVRRAGGKPDLAGALAADTTRGALRFNYSHTRGYVACAIARGNDIGVDVEEVVPFDGLQGMLQFVLHPRETNSSDAGAAEAPLDTFFRIWTAKEALLKATGHGLSVNLRQIALRHAKPQTLQLVTAPRELAPFIGTLIGHGVLPVNGRRYAYAAALLRREARFEFMHVAAAKSTPSNPKEAFECACA